jgi:Fe-S oxidoreductase
MIDQLLKEGRIGFKPQTQRIIFHDPCYLGRHNGQYEAPRNVLKNLTGSMPVEFEWSRERSQCCGAGGGRMWLEESTGRRMNILRVEQALARSPAIIATACPYCAVMMDDGLAAVAPGQAQAQDIAELVAEALLPAAAPLKLMPMGDNDGPKGIAG